MAYINTIFPGFIPEGYFSDDNVEFLANKITQILSRDYRQKILFDRGSIKRLMQRVLNERLESIPRMNQRVVMYATNEYRNHQDQLNKNLKLEAHYISSQLLYDASTDRGPDMQHIKLSQRLGKENVGGTTRFYFS